MNFSDYQKLACSTAIYPQQERIKYPALGLAGETGEVCEQIKKALRDDEGEFTTERLEALRKELGDVLWYVANLAADLCLDLDTIAAVNIQKLQDRQKRGVLKGEGDER